jgi:hypothetical protein
MLTIGSRWRRCSDRVLCHISRLRQTRIASRIAAWMLRGPAVTDAVQGECAPVIVDDGLRFGRSPWPPDRAPRQRFQCLIKVVIRQRGVVTDDLVKLWFFLVFAVGIAQDHEEPLRSRVSGRIETPSL